ncbi:MAG: low-specificity L-threonine aldolase [Desulfobacteraceae bacterium]|nr:low-specificity L-threonine aldolase [Desulfobacteraceae bacterium]
MIDLRSDTVTKPSNEMLESMFKAELGDDVYGEDPTINQLEEMIADMLGMEAAIFASSGTQTNLLALLTHCRRGDEYIVGQLAHTYKYEAGGGAVLGSIQPQPLDFEKDGTLDLNKVLRFIKPDDFHFANTQLLCLENTTAGLALPMDYLNQAKIFIEDNKLKFHLDGARIFNAAVKHGVKADTISSLFDSVSVCFSKGLGAPVGSALCGSKEQIKEARRWRKMLGGGMRQAGMLAGACIYALENNIDRLSQDHDNAQFFAKGLSEIQGLNVEYDPAQTNMVFVKLEEDSSDFVNFMKDKGILIYPGKDLRLVTHLDISIDNIKTVINAFKKYFI